MVLFFSSDLRSHVLCPTTRKCLRDCITKIEVAWLIGPWLWYWPLKIVWNYSRILNGPLKFLTTWTEHFFFYDRLLMLTLSVFSFPLVAFQIFRPIRIAFTPTPSPFLVSYGLNVLLSRFLLVEDVALAILVILVVPDRRSRVLEVVIVRRLVLGFWEFGGGRDWEGVQKGEVSLQATWDQGGPILSHLGGFPSK